jgi:hypothetical protein
MTTYDPAVVGGEADADEHTLGCASCGENAVREWCKTSVGYDLNEVERDEDGVLAYDYTGERTVAEDDSTEEFWCRSCDASAKTLEELFGLAKEEK